MAIINNKYELLLFPCSLCFNYFQIFLALLRTAVYSVDAAMKIDAPRGLGNQPRKVGPRLSRGMVRSSMLEEIHQDYVRTARAKGLSEGRVLFRHALQNGLIPVLTVMGLQLGNLLAGAIIIETIFSWPGLGQLLFQAISARDYPLVQGCILAIALTYIVVNRLTDVIYSLVDPRIRYE